MECLLTNSATLHFARCRSSSLDLEMRPWFISVNSRLSVSGGRLSQRSERLVSPSMDCKQADFKGVAVPRAISERWFLKCILKRCDCANNSTPSSVDIGRCGLERIRWCNPARMPVR